MADRRRLRVSVDVTIAVGPIEQRWLIDLDPEDDVEKTLDEREVEQ